MSDGTAASDREDAGRRLSRDGGGHTAGVNIRHALPASLLVLATIGLAACGDDDSSSSGDTTSGTEAPATTDASDGTAASGDGTAATDTSVSGDDTTGDTGAPTTGGAAPDQDSEFCRSATETESLGDEVDAVQNGTPEEIEAAVTAALESSKETLELAPPEIESQIRTRVEFQQRFTDLLTEFEWDAEAALTSPAGTQLLTDADAVEEQAQVVRDYLQTNCGIEDDSQSNASTTPAVDLPEGDEGLRQFIQLYARGADVEVTQEQEDCFVKELSGKVETDQLETALNGTATEAIKISVGLAVLACEIEIESS